MLSARIEQGGILYALILNTREPREFGPRFFTDSDQSMQVGLLQYPTDHVIPAHLHLETERRIADTQEVLLVMEGRAEVSFYDEDCREFATHPIEAGDLLILMRGGHGFRILEDIRLLEVKQGPYNGVTQDKRLIKPKT